MQPDPDCLPSVFSIRLLRRSCQKMPLLLELASMLRAGILSTKIVSALSAGFTSGPGLPIARAARNR